MTALVQYGNSGWVSNKAIVTCTMPQPTTQGNSLICVCWGRADVFGGAGGALGGTGGFTANSGIGLLSFNIRYNSGPTAGSAGIALVDCLNTNTSITTVSLQGVGANTFYSSLIVFEVAGGIASLDTPGIDTLFITGYVNTGMVQANNISQSGVNNFTVAGVCMNNLAGVTGLSTPATANAGQPPFTSVYYLNTGTAQTPSSDIDYRIEAGPLKSAAATWTNTAFCNYAAVLASYNFIPQSGFFAILDNS